MRPELIQALLALLARVPLKGDEAPAFMEMVGSLRAMLDTKPKADAVEG